MIADAHGMEAREDHRRHPAEDRRSRRSRASYLAVDPGYVCGIVQDGVGYRKGEPVITLHMEAYLGAPESYDAVEIDGLAGVEDEDRRRRARRHRDGVDHGQLDAEDPRRAAGLHTMRDMPIPSFFPGA